MYRYTEGKVLDDIVDALARHRRLLRQVNREQVEIVELRERRLVHDVYLGEVRNKEVDQPGAVRNGAVF